MRILAIRSFALLLPLLGAAVAWLWLQPTRRTAGAVYLSTLWTLPSLFAVHALARSFGWWTFHFAGADFFGMPVDLLLGWALLWGALPALLLMRVPLPFVSAIMIGIDLVLMPLCAPVVQLGSRWLVGELVAVALVLIPAQLLARWTAHDTHLGGRAMLQIALFTGLVPIGIPAVVLAATNGVWHFAPLHAIVEQLLLQCAIAVVILGLTAVQEFVERGRGTPFPYDPPKTFVRSGIYAYVRNPMQLSASALLTLIALTTMNGWLGVAAFVSVAYAAGFAAWDEGSDLRERFGEDAKRYAAAVRNWLPSWRPSIEQRSTIYLAMGCDPCSEIAAWLQSRKPLQLQFVPAEQHPTTDLDRVRYEAPDGHIEDGIAAIACALEHIHFAWAIVGFAMRLPIARQILQTIVDASGGGKRIVLRTNRPQDCSYDRT
jgi:protein-S-isoprenylcysteine O-methyltransferase Ste14